jgi:hypothetical protein
MKPEDIADLVQLYLRASQTPWLPKRKLRRLLSLWTKFYGPGSIKKNKLMQAIQERVDTKK